MSARYWVLCSDELMASDDLRLPDSLRPVEPNGYERPGMRWWLFEDDDALETLNGKRIDLRIGLRDGEPVVVARRPAE